MLKNVAFEETKKVVSIVKLWIFQICIFKKYNTTNFIVANQSDYISTTVKVRFKNINN